MSKNVAPSDPKPSTLVAFIDAVALRAHDDQGPPEPQAPIKTAKQESKIVAGRGRQDKTA